MATAVEPKSSRLDMRLTPGQREEIERAAAFKGMGITQWAVSCLVESARREIMEETTTRISTESFDDFMRACDEGMPEATKRLLEDKRVWDD